MVKETVFDGLFNAEESRNCLNLTLQYALTGGIDGISANNEWTVNQLMTMSVRVLEVA